MCYTYTVRETLSRLARLDDSLTTVRVAMKRPRYRRALLEGIDVPGGDGVLRSLRAIELLTGETRPSIKAIAAQLGIEHSTASRLIDGAERNGLLTKQSSQADLRRTDLSLTEKGEHVLEQSSIRRQDLLDAATRGWSPQELETLADLLDRLTEGLESLQDKA